MVIGGLIALAGFATVAYLAGNGNRIVAAVMGTFLATILAVVVGRRIGE